MKINIVDWQSLTAKLCTHNNNRWTRFVVKQITELAWAAQVILNPKTTSVMEKAYDNALETGEWLHQPQNR